MSSGFTELPGGEYAKVTTTMLRFWRHGADKHGARPAIAAQTGPELRNSPLAIHSTATLMREQRNQYLDEGAEPPVTLAHQHIQLTTSPVVEPARLSNHERHEQAHEGKDGYIEMGSYMDTVEDVAGER